MTLHDLLAPEVATAAELIPFDEMTAEILATLACDAAGGHAALRRGRADRPRRAGRSRGAGAGPPGEASRRRAPVHLLDARRRLRDRQQRRWTTRCSTCCARSSTSSACRSSTDWPRRRRTRGRSRTATRVCAGPTSTRRSWGSTRTASACVGVSAGWRPGRGAGAAGARPGRGAGGVPAPRLADARRPAAHRRRAARTGSRCGAAARTRSVGSRTWASSTAATTCPPPRRPRRADDLSGLPPAFVSVGAVDGFRDEDVDYALRLNQAGVPAELHVYPGACHGFNQLAPDAPVSKQCNARHRGLAARGSSPSTGDDSPDRAATSSPRRGRASLVSTR